MSTAQVITFERKYVLFPVLSVPSKNDKTKGLFTL